MSIIHIQKRENPYAMIDKRPLEHGKMTWAAKGMLCYLLSKPATWKVCVEDLIASSKDGKDAVYTIITELLKLGHMSRSPVREKGRFVRWDYIVFEESQTTSGKTRNGKTRNGKTRYGESATSNNDSNKNELNNNEEADACASKDLNKLFIDTYFNWYKEQNNGLEPKLDKGDYAALKTLREYFLKSKKEDAPAALQSFEYILQNWAVLKDYRYLYTSKSPKQINSNLVNILPVIREHYEKVSKSKEGTVENPKTLKGEEYYDYYGGLNPNFKQPNQ